MKHGIESQDAGASIHARRSEPFARALGPSGRTLEFLAGCIALLLLTTTGCGGDEREKLIVYSPHGKEMLREYERAFEAAHPEVDVQWIDMGGQDAYDRIRTEANNPQASVWWGGASTTFDHAAREGLLEEYRPTWAEAAPEDARHPQDLWYGTYYTPEVITYNTRTLEESLLPSDWDELLEDRWRGRILIRYPLASSTMRTIFGALIMRQPTVEEGYRWLARLDRNVKTYTADPTQLYLRLAREEGDLSLWNMPDTYIQADVNGYPFDAIIPSSGTPVLTDGIAIVRNAPSLQHAKQFYEFVTTDSALVHQAHTYYRIPIRSDISQDRLPEWIRRADVVPMEMDWERLAEEGPEWMQYWDENIKGRGDAYLQRSNSN